MLGCAVAPKPPKAGLAAVAPNKPPDCCVVAVAPKPPKAGAAEAAGVAPKPPNAGLAWVQEYFKDYVRVCEPARLCKFKI